MREQARAVMKTLEAGLIEKLTYSNLPADLLNEGDLERRFIVPIVGDLVRKAGTHVYAHPWRLKQACEPNCTKGVGLVELPTLHGCPECWKSSKKWAAVRLYGLHCFDLVVGAPGASLAIEAKLLKGPKTGKKRANGGFQRLVGQCMLARLVHPRVIGFCVAQHGALDNSAVSHLEAVRARGIELIVRTVKPYSVSSE